MNIVRSSLDCEPVKEKSNVGNGRAGNEGASLCRCSKHQQQEHQTRVSQAENPSKRLVEFNADMLKDQELLVSTLSQQGISEALIRRQFNKLLEEQCKQLALQRERADKELQQPNCARERKPISETRESPPPLDPRKRSEPSSLLKLKVKREMQDSRSRNNGLQDLTTAAQIIDKSKSRADARAAYLRLNGTQDSAVADQESEFCRAHGLRQAQLSCSSLPPARPLNVSANGLANSRKLSQQHSQPGGDAQQPVQQQQQQQTRAELERSLEDAQMQLANHAAQQSAACCPDIQEPRVFGGFTYLARKPEAGCLPQFPAHPLPQPHVNSSRSTTAF